MKKPGEEQGHDPSEIALHAAAVLVRLRDPALAAAPMRRVRWWPAAGVAACSSYENFRVTVEVERAERRHKRSSLEG